MTKVIILGEPAEKKEGKKIKFVKAFVHQMEWINCTSTPSDWENIELICKNYNKSSEDPYDLMYAYDDERNMGNIYLGHFNDGIV